MATHSSVPAWRIPGTAGLGGLPSMGSHRVRHDWSNLAAVAAVRMNQQRALCSVGRVLKMPFPFLPSEKAMATHSSTLARKIPWTEEPGGLQSMGSLRVGHDWATSLSLSSPASQDGVPQLGCGENCPIFTLLLSFHSPRASPNTCPDLAPNNSPTWGPWGMWCFQQWRAPPYLTSGPFSDPKPLQSRILCPGLRSEKLPLHCD